MERELEWERALERERERERERGEERAPERSIDRAEGRGAVRDRRPLTLVRPPASRGTPVDLDRLYREMHGGLVRYAMRDLDPDEAKDVVHDALLKYIEQLARQPHAEPEEEARPRLVAMVHDVIRDRKRASKRRHRLMQLISGSTAAISRWTNPRRSAEDEEIVGAIHEALEAMPACHRVVWMTVKEQGMTAEETGALLGISAGAVRAAVHKANTELRRRLKRDGITPASLRGRDEA